MSGARQIPIAEGLFTWPSSAPRLIAGRCNTCGSVFFPRFYQVHRPECSRPEVADLLLGRNGILRSFTSQHYPAPPPFRGPEPFVPYPIGMVEFPEGIQIYGIVSGCRFEDLRMHMEMAVAAHKLYEDAQGNEMMTWGFRPVGPGEGSAR